MVVYAGVDTAAEITIISQRVYESLKARPGDVKEMHVRLAGDGASMTASFLGEVEIGMNEYQYHHPVYIAELQDYMLLGINFLQTNHTSLSCCSGEFWFDGSTEAHKMHKPSPEVRSMLFL